MVYHMRVGVCSVCVCVLHIEYVMSSVSGRQQSSTKLLDVRKNLESLYSLVLKHGTQEQERRNWGNMNWAVVAIIPY